MKPILKCLAAGSLAVIGLLLYQERTAMQGLFNPGTKSEQASNYTQKKTASKPALQFTVPPNTVTVAAETIKSPSPATLSKNNAVAVEAHQPALLTHALVSLRRPYVHRNKIDVSKLLKNISVETASRDLATKLTVKQPAELSRELVSVQPSVNGMVATRVKTVAVKRNAVARNGAKRNTASSNYENQSFASLKQADEGADSYSYESLYEQTKQLQDYAIQYGANPELGIMINLGLKSAKKRFFIVDLTTNTIIKMGIVAEGENSRKQADQKKDALEPGVVAGAAGVYKVDKHAKGRFNPSYKLYSMQNNGNSSVAQKSMKLMSSKKVPYAEAIAPLMKTKGNLSVSVRFFKEIRTMLNQSEKPVLLWVYDGSEDTKAMYSAVSRSN